MAKQPFIPNELPPKGIDYSLVLADLISARDAIARYDEAVKRLPNPGIIERTFETKEAVLSSRIEGTQVTLEDVFMLDAEGVNGEFSEKEIDYREVVNYRRAIMLGKQILEKKPLTENVIKELHRILLSSVRGENRAPGEFRRGQVYIGRPGASIEEAIFIPPPANEIIRLFSNLEKYLHLADVVDPLIQIAIAHYQFEAIHPFCDGNGRVGRLLVPLFLYEKEITKYPNIYISEYLEEHRSDYYDILRNVSEKEDWISWIKFFLIAVREQTKLTYERVHKIELLHQTLMSRLPEFNSIYALSFIDAIFQSPRFSVKKIREITKIVNIQTLYTLIGKFQAAGVIIDITPNRERNKVYSFAELQKIIR